MCIGTMPKKTNTKVVYKKVSQGCNLNKRSENF